MQNKGESTLVIKDKSTDEYIYVFSNKVPPRIMYEKKNEYLIKKVFNKAHVERYML